MKEQTNGVGKNAEEGKSVWTVSVGMLITGLIVGFLIGWFLPKGASEVNVTDETQGNASTTSANIMPTSTVPALETTYKTINTQAVVSVDDQRSGGLVFIKHVEASSPTWIAVREVVDGSIGNILGAEMITGATDDVPVTLLRPTKVGGQYAVFLYQDNGDGRFDFKTDLLVTQNGTPVEAEFTAQ